ncbi:hypothetical protein MBLNU230_g3716t1 [Neophaeotheca triangularis]
MRDKKPQLNDNGIAQRSLTMPTRARSESLTARNTPTLECQAFASPGDTVADGGGDVHMSGTTTTGDATTNNQDDHLKALGRDSSLFIQTIQKLEDLGIDNTLPSLPRFVVVGDQSAGKSSVIEATCDITLPRAAGTCTRCPFQITTKEGTQWSCSVSVRKAYSFDSSVRADEQNAFDHWWRLETPELTHLRTVYAKEELAETLRRAQMVVLNPNDDAHKIFNTPQAVKKNRAMFSPNVVTLDIEGPGLLPMSFYDLPGAINVAEDAADDYLVHTVETLIKTYLEQAKTLILLACSADQDFENSTTFRFIRHCKAVDRCMGVLTKPDLLNSARVGFVRDVLKGDKFKLEQGWMVVKCASQQDLDSGVTHASARDMERAFFKNSNVWGQRGALGQFSALFGITHLQSAMSQTLRSFILQDLPEITERVDRQYQVVCDELAGFPEQPQNTRLTVESELSDVIREIDNHLAGDGLTNRFRTAYQEVLRNFKASLLDARPKVKLASPGFVAAVTEISDDDDDDEHDESMASTPSKRKTPPARTNGRNGATPVRTPAASRANGVNVKREFTESATTPSTPASDKTPMTITIQEIKDLYENGSTSGIPGQISPLVTEHIISMTMRGWPSLVKKVKHDVATLFSRMLKTTITKTLTTRKHTQLSKKTTESALAYFETIMAVQKTALDHLLAVERLKPATLQDMRPARELVRASLVADRTDQRILEHHQNIASTSKLPAESERRKKTLENPGWHRLPADPFATQLEALVTPLAYYDLASARFVDAVVGQLELGLVETLRKGLGLEIREKLRTWDEGACEVLLAEDAGRGLRRATLVLEKGKLEKAVGELEKLSG